MIATGTEMQTMAVKLRRNVLKDWQYPWVSGRLAK